MSITSQNSNWPGERDPSHQDVASANEIPDPALLSDFKRTLISSGDVARSEKLLHMDLKYRVWTSIYIWKLILNIYRPLYLRNIHILWLCCRISPGCRPMIA